VVTAAAGANNLSPEVVSAFLLAESRDQSQNEDAKDMLAAKTLGHNSSIGLGQVVVSTARRHALFDQLLGAGGTAKLSESEVAEALADDVFNIYATAKYIRIVADLGSKLDPASLPRTLADFPGLELNTLAGNSAAWSGDTVGALGKYYASRPWTDSPLSTGWGWFVSEAFKDVSSSGVFR